MGLRVAAESVETRAAKAAQCSVRDKGVAQFHENVVRRDQAAPQSPLARIARACKAPLGFTTAR